VFSTLSDVVDTKGLMFFFYEMTLKLYSGKEYRDALMILSHLAEKNSMTSHICIIHLCNHLM